MNKDVLLVINTSLLVKTVLEHTRTRFPLEGTTSRQTLENYLLYRNLHPDIAIGMLESLGLLNDQKLPTSLSIGEHLLYHLPNHPRERILTEVLPMVHVTMRGEYLISSLLEILKCPLFEEPNS